MNIEKFIAIYQTKRLLWDTRDPEYHNRQKREDMWKEISTKLNIPAKELKAKMTSLMGSFRRERSRERKSFVTGSGMYLIHYKLQY